RLKYQWDNGETSARATDLTAGSHAVTVTDQNGCTATATVEISRETATLTASLVRQESVPCAQSNEQTVQLNVSGGVEPYNIAWTDPNINGNMATGLKPGTYAVTVTDAEKNTVQSSIHLSEVELLQVTATQL